MRSIPSIEQLRQRPELRELEARHGRAALVEALRAEADALRATLRAGGTVDGDAADAIVRGLPSRLAATAGASLRRVINATGVILHTNLGRAPLATSAVQRVAALAAGYTNLEYDLADGRRGRRDAHAERLICHLTGAAAAVVVNNNAAATLLALAALAAGREVIISRGELVEIGGGFRVPDVMQQSGAVLREVGTTNRTRAADYAAAIGERTALILRVHPSNFRIEGFTERPSLEELVSIGRKFNVPVAEDLGSGWLGVREFESSRVRGFEGSRVREFEGSRVREFEGSRVREVEGSRVRGVEGSRGREFESEGSRVREFGARLMRDEPIVSASVAAGADVVMFSGDKLLGGPQAGIIAGGDTAVSAIRRHPLMRALRVDKMTYAALEATLQEHAAGRAAREIPIVRMLTMSVEEIDARARAVAAALSASGMQADVIDGESTVGGGSAPGSAIPTRLVALTHPSLGASQLEARLRAGDPPIIARIENDRVVIDLRTVLPADDDVLTGLLTADRT